MRRARRAAGVLALALALGACGRACGADDATRVEIVRVAPAARPLETPEKPPFPTLARCEGDDCYLQIPSEHADALRAFVQTARPVEGWKVIVGPAREEGLVRTYVVSTKPLAAPPCAKVGSRSDDETAVELAAPCAADVAAAGGPIAVLFEGAMAAPPVPASSVSGGRLTIETAHAEERN